MIKPFAITLDEGSSLANHTGTWRTRRPEYVDRLPPCNDACPAGENVQRWLYHAEEGDYRGAWEGLIKDNPLPAVMGRACYHPCETSCNRAKLDQAVSIHAVERFLGDLAIQEKWRIAAPSVKTGKKVLVVGAGPSGLSAAYHLARMGHSVTIREALPRAGGMMRYGIPKYRLPREVLDSEITRILDLGVRLECGAPVDDLLEAIEAGGYGACFAAIGAHLAHRVEIPTSDATRILDAVDLLRDVEGGEAPRIGRRVAVYGGGNTALDAARTVKRLGADEACIVYRRSPAQMPARAFEVQEATEEGIQIRWLRTIQRFDEGKLFVERMEIDAQGKLRATGEIDAMEADTLVLAVGQSVDLSILERVGGVHVSDRVVEVDDRMMTGHAGLFAGGDMVPSERTVAVAVGHGKKAARHIDAYLRGAVWTPPPRHELAGYEALNPWYYTDADRTVQPTLDALRRRTTFDEVHGGLTPENALFEARRCLSCGNCFECDNCYGVCPDNAIIKQGPGQGFRVDLDFCKGCGMCAAECPCGAIRMVDEKV
ncbi:MAG TPA: NAD(P)-binding protein [Polyangiaceae bacterium]|nr:NAD(P)-binding protein [Polyangiaceae bacterium]